MKTAFLITSIEEYGKLMSYCIEHDISVFRTYWDEREKGDRCYHIEFNQHSKSCGYSNKNFYLSQGYKIVIPKFRLNKYGKYTLIGGD